MPKVPSMGKTESSVKAADIPSTSPLVNEVAHFSFVKAVTTFYERTSRARDNVYAELDYIDACFNELMAALAGTGFEPSATDQLAVARRAVKDLFPEPDSFLTRSETGSGRKKDTVRDSFIAELYGQGVPDAVIASTIAELGYVRPTRSVISGAVRKVRRQGWALPARTPGRKPNK